MKTTVLAAFMVAAVLAAGCNKPAATSSSSSGSKTIGVSIQNREAQFYQDMQNGMQAEASKYGYTLKVVDASRDNSKQQSQVEDFISQPPTLRAHRTSATSSRTSQATTCRVANRPAN